MREGRDILAKIHAYRGQKPVGWDKVREAFPGAEPYPDTVAHYRFDGHAKVGDIIGEMHRELIVQVFGDEAGTLILNGPGTFKLNYQHDEEDIRPGTISVDGKIWKTRFENGLWTTSYSPEGPLHVEGVIGENIIGQTYEGLPDSYVYGGDHEGLFRKFIPGDAVVSKMITDDEGPDTPVTYVSFVHQSPDRPAILVDALEALPPLSNRATNKPMNSRNRPE